MKMTKRILSITIMAIMIATTFGVVTTPEVSAASGLPKVSSLKADSGQVSVTLSWKKLTKKQQKKVKGIAIYRDGSLIKNVSKKTGSYTDPDLKAGTDYSYTVKTYKATKKKEWFNKQTGKWQKKKPAKQYRGKSRKVKAYSKGVSISAATLAIGSQGGSNNQQGGIDGNKLTQYINCNGSHTLTVGQKYNLNGTASSGLPVTYTSQYPSIASVNSSGLVTAVSAGSTYIYIRQAGNGTYNPAEKRVTITVTAGQNQDPGTDTDPIAVSGAFKIDQSNMTLSMEDDKYLIDINKGRVNIPLTLPAHVKSISWVTQNNGTANSRDTMTIDKENNGKALYITANNALNTKGNYGSLTVIGTITMEDGYYLADESVSTYRFKITNTVYPLVSTLSEKTYDFKSFNRPVVNNNIRSLYVFRELPDNSTININLGEYFDGNRDVRLLLPTDDWEILNRTNVVGKIISPIFYNGQIRLIKAGTFQMYFPKTEKTMTFVLSGSASTYINDYYTHLNSVASQCKTSDEITTIKNCLAYIFTHYTYRQGGGGMWTDGYGDCASGNQYLTDLLNVCGIEAYCRNASIEKPNHYNTAVILKDGTKYIADGTPDYDASSTSEALEYIEDTMDQHSGRYSVIILWDEYDAFYDAVTITFFGL